MGLLQAPASLRPRLAHSERQRIGLLVFTLLVPPLVMDKLDVIHIDFEALGSGAVEQTEETLVEYLKLFSFDPPRDSLEYYYSW